MAKPSEAEGKQPPATDNPVIEAVETKGEESTDVGGSDAAVPESKGDSNEEAHASVVDDQEKKAAVSGDGDDEKKGAVQDEVIKDEKAASDGDNNDNKIEEITGGDEGANNKKEATSGSVDLGLDDLVLSSLDVYDLGNYTFGRKERVSRSVFLRSEDRAAAAEHYRARFEEHGLRRSVAAVLLVHLHRFAHILLLQRADGTGGYALPGGRLRPGESLVGGLERKLARKLCTNTDDYSMQDIEVGELLATWYRIEFGGSFYPYLPAHLSAPKEELHVYSVCLPESFAFAVPKNMQLIAIPVYDLFENTEVYGNVIAAVPSLLSRFQKNYC